jgi:hypothetical protein
MSYSIYKNKKLLKELSEKDYRLLKFNSKLINPFHTYLMYSLVPSELNELSFKDLNSVVEIFKKNINKFVKKKFNKNYVNANAQKDLDIFAELCHLNISIFNNNFNNLHSSTKNKKYTKRLYLINRDNDLFLLIKKNKNGLKLKLGNNVLKPIQSGGGEPASKKARTTLAPMFGDNYYNPDKVNDFLRTYCKKLIKKGERTDALTKLIDSIIYPQAQDIKNYDYESFKIFKSLSIKDKKKDQIFGDLFKSRDTLLRQLKTQKKITKQTITSNTIKKVMPNELLTHEEKLILTEEWLNKVYKADNDIIDILEKLKEEKGKLNKEKLEHFKEIIIAAFTDYMRDDILILIKRIEKNINIKMKDESKIYGKLIGSDDSPVRIVISGGSGFNNLIEKANRPISPDIDVKLCLHTQEAIALHEHMTKGGNVEYIKSLQMEVARQLLIVRTHLFNVMEDKAKEFSKYIIELGVENFNNMFKNLYKYCKETLMGGQDIPFLKSLDLNEDEDVKGIWKKEFNEETVKVLVRETLMKRGIDGDPAEKNPYKLHDVFLYSLDLPFNKKSGFDSLAGILDIVVSIPGHIGYILPSYSNLQVKEGCYNITDNYYKYELIKLITYGLRTTNKKILKDLVRYKILLELDQNKEGPVLRDLLHINKVIKGIDDKTLKKELGELLSGAINVGLKNSQIQEQFSKITDEDLIVIQSDTQDSDEHLINLDEQCSSQEDVISESSVEDYDEKMRQMYIDLHSGITEFGSLEPFVIDCIYHGECSDREGGSKKNKQIGGGGPCGNVEMLSLSKVFQLMVNNKSMEGFINFTNIKLVPDKNNEKYKNFVPKINFEKLTESEATKKNINIYDEYLSTKASDRVASFRMSTKVKDEIEKICDHLITEVIKKGNINKLCYCYENEDYKPEPGNPIVPSEQEYAAFLLTQCQVLKTINEETKKLYSAIDGIANPNVNMIPKKKGKLAVVKPNLRKIKSKVYIPDNELL